MPRFSKKRHGLSSDDLEIWRAVAKTTTPLHKERSEPPLSEKAEAGFATRLAPAVPAMPAPQRQRQKSAKEPLIRMDIRKDHEGPHPVLRRSAVMDQRNFERLKKGKKPIDGTIDLHGMRVHEAQNRLTDTIMRAHFDEKRLILVITGKGKAQEAGAWDDDIRPGVLRRSVPHWLAMPPLAPLILQVTQAHGKHGGWGAFYVYLKRRRARG